MIRTQLYLPEDQHKTLLTAAKLRHTSMANLVRDYIQAGLQHSTTHDGGQHVMQKLAQLKLQGGPKDLSTRLDDYLYKKD